MISRDTVTAGAPFNLTVMAVDPFGRLAVGYTGRVHFACNDPQGRLPAHATFTASDNGVQTFTVTLETAGARNLTVRDKADHRIKGRATITVTSRPAAGRRPRAWQIFREAVP